MFAIQKASVGIGPLCESAYPGGPLLNTIVNHNTAEGISLMAIVHNITKKKKKFNSTELKSSHLTDSKSCIMRY